MRDSGWIRTLDRAGSMGAAAAEAVQEARRQPGQVASLIIPADHSWSDAGQPASPAAVAIRPLPAESNLHEAARAATVAKFAALLTRALATKGPRLIEAQL